MATVLRMARGGAKKRPYYRIVAADKRAPRDGKYLERIGSYDPMLPKDDPNRIVFKEDRVKHWLSTGAKPSETVARFLRAKGVADIAPGYKPKTKGTGLKQKALEKIKAEEEAKKAAEEEAKAAAEAEAAPAEEAPAEEEKKEA